MWTFTLLHNYILNMFQITLTLYIYIIHFKSQCRSIVRLETQIVRKYKLFQLDMRNKNAYIVH